MIGSQAIKNHLSKNKSNIPDKKVYLTHMKKISDTAPTESMNSNTLKLLMNCCCFSRSLLPALFHHRGPHDRRDSGFWVYGPSLFLYEVLSLVSCQPPQLQYQLNVTLEPEHLHLKVPEVLQTPNVPTWICYLLYRISSTGTSCTTTLNSSFPILPVTKIIPLHFCKVDESLQSIPISRTPSCPTWILIAIFS